MAAGAGAIALGARDARAAGDMGPVAPPSTVTSPPRDLQHFADFAAWAAERYTVKPSIEPQPTSAKEVSIS